MMEETRKWGVLALVSITVLAILFGVLAGVRSKKLAIALNEERSKRLALESKVRDLSQSIAQIKSEMGQCVKMRNALLQENKTLKKQLADANRKISSLQKELKRLNVLKETLEENLKNALMAIPEDQRKNVVNSEEEQ